MCTLTDMKSLVLIMLLAVLPVVSIAGVQQPNIIYILADDLGYGDLGCYGQKVIETPCLDKMAAQGLRFTQHYSGSTVCGPSRSCMLTGKHTGHTFLRGNGNLQMRPDPLDVIFPSALQKAGYHTALIGKSGLACNSDDGSLPNVKGFDYFFGFTSHWNAHWYYPYHLWRNGKKIKYTNNKRHHGDRYSSELVINETLRYLERQKEGPFFLHVAFQLPHASLRAKEEWKAKYRPILKETPLPPQKSGKGYSYEREPKTTYAAMVSYMDHNVGRILDKLKELGLDSNTLVIFSSDNGAMQEGGHKRSSFNSSGELRGGKRDMYEGGVRTPTIAWWPGTISSGLQTDHLSAFWDISPTLRELAGAEAQTDTDGLSIVPTLLGKEGQKKHRYLYWEFYEAGGKQALLKGKWKLIYLNTVKDSNPKPELYNLDVDPAETKNVASQYPEIVSELKKNMQEAHTPSEYPDFKFASEK